MNERFRVVPAAYVMLMREAGARTEVLLQLRQNTGFMDGYWAVGAAGHVEEGESVFEAACREVLEELSVGVTAEDLSPVCVMHRTRGTGEPVDERVDFFFKCRRWTGIPRIVEPAKTADLRWFSLDALPDPVVPHERRVLEELRKGAVPRVLTHGFPAPH